MSAFQVLTETNAVAVAILNVKIAAAIRLVADVACDLHAPGLEFSIERISSVYPNVSVPCPALRINQVIRAHRTSRFQLSQHDYYAVALDHTKRRRIIPEPLIMKAKLVAIVVRGADHVIDDEIRSTGPALAVLHDLITVSTKTEVSNGCCCAHHRRAGRVSGAARLWQSLPTDALLFARALDRAFDDITA